MKHAASVAALFAITGCAGSWQVKAKQTLVGIHSANKAASGIGLDYYGRKCKAVATACKASADTKCDKLRACQSMRRAFAKVLDTIDIAIIAGYGSIALGDKAATEQRIAKGLMLIAEVHALLRKVGAL